jgi:hypothetical protein
MMSQYLVLNKKLEKMQEEEDKKASPSLPWSAQKRGARIFC